jgi:hypothetical protein
MKARQSDCGSGSTMPERCEDGAIGLPILEPGDLGALQEQPALLVRGAPGYAIGLAQLALGFGQGLTWIGVEMEAGKQQQRDESHASLLEEGVGG